MNKEEGFEFHEDDGFKKEDITVNMEMPEQLKSLLEFTKTLLKNDGFLQPVLFITDAEKGMCLVAIVGAFNSVDKGEMLKELGKEFAKNSPSVDVVRLTMISEAEIIKVGVNECIRTNAIVITNLGVKENTREMVVQNFKRCGERDVIFDDVSYNLIDISAKFLLTSFVEGFDYQRRLDANPAYN